MGSDAKIVVVGVEPTSLLNFRGDLLRDLTSAGQQVIACSSPAPASIIEMLNSWGVEHRSIPFDRTGINPFADFYTIKALRALMRETRPTRALFYTIKPVIYGGLASRGLGIDVYTLITGLGYAFTPGGIKQRAVGGIVRGLYKLALGQSSSVIFQNPDDEALFKSLGLMKPTTSSHVVRGSGVSTERFCQAPLPEPPVFLLIARLVADKGIREYAAAAALVKARYPKSRFMLAGPFDPNPSSIHKAELDKWIQDDVIEYMGALSDVREAMTQARCYVLPSFYREGTPRTILEAMSMGRPIITTDAPGCRETVDPERNGILVRPRDVGSLVQAMTYFIENPGEAERMGLASRERAVSLYDVNKVNEHMLRIMGIETKHQPPHELKRAS